MKPTKEERLAWDEEEKRKATEILVSFNKRWAKFRTPIIFIARYNYVVCLLAILFLAVQLFINDSTTWYINATVNVFLIVCFLAFLIHTNINSVAICEALTFNDIAKEWGEMLGVENNFNNLDYLLNSGYFIDFPFVDEFAESPNMTSFILTFGVLKGAIIGLISILGIAFVFPYYYTEFKLAILLLLPTVIIAIIARQLHKIDEPLINVHFFSPDSELSKSNP